MAMKDVDVRRRLVGMTLQRFDFMVLGMPAARSDHLVLLQMRDVVGLQVIGREVGYSPLGTYLNRRLRQNLALERGPARLKPLFGSNLGLRLLGDADFDSAERVRYHASVKMFAPTSHVIVSPVATVNVEP